MNEMQSLYFVSSEYRNLCEALFENADEETGEVDEMLARALTVKEEAFAEAAVNVATIFRRLENEEALYKAEIERLEKIKSKIASKKESVANAIKIACERTGVTKINGVHANISFRASERTIIDDEKLIPEEYITKKVVESIDKTKLKTALKNGVEIVGARIEKIQNIQIK